MQSESNLEVLLLVSSSSSLHANAYLRGESKLSLSSSPSLLSSWSSSLDDFGEILWIFISLSHTHTRSYFLNLIFPWLNPCRFSLLRTNPNEIKLNKLSFQIWYISFFLFWYGKKKEKYIKHLLNENKIKNHCKICPFHKSNGMDCFVLPISFTTIVALVH